MAHVLLVEDELLVSQAFREALEDEGHRVTAVQDGSAALAADQRDPAEVLVTDLRMPRMGGLEVLSRLRVRRPGLPAVIVSGYPADVPDLGETGAALTAVLCKPVTPSRLAGRVSALLGRAPGAA